MVKSIKVVNLVIFCLIVNLSGGQLIGGPFVSGQLLIFSPGGQFVDGQFVRGEFSARTKVIQYRDQYRPELLCIIAFCA